MTMTNPFTVPELLDRILDYLHDNHASLLAASLVCRSMHPSCQYHLLHDITLSTHDRMKKLFNHLTKHTHTAHLVHSLTIQSLRVSSTNVFSLLESVQQLSTLRLSQTKIYSDPPDTVYFSSMHSIVLDNCRFDHVKQLVEMVSRFTKLDSLVVRKSYSDLSSGLDLLLSTMLVGPPCISVRSLECDHEVYNGALAKILKPPDLREFITTVRGAEAFKNVLVFGREVGSHLVKLHLTLLMYDDNIAFPRTSNIPSNRVFVYT